MDIFGVIISNDSLWGFLIMQITSLPQYYLTLLSYTWWRLDLILDIMCFVLVYYFSRNVVSEYKQDLMRVILPATISLVLQFSILIGYMYLKVFLYYFV